MSESIRGVASLLGQVRLLKDKHDALAAANGTNFNVFALLGRETDEVHTHSAILADLLNPKGSHGQGAAFARLFPPLRDMEKESELEYATVGAEVTVDSGRLDILIETDHWCIVIENKIHAGDQERQLERYHQYASSTDKSFRLYYLTLHGDEPSRYSLGCLKRDEVVCISYESDVHAWLEGCIKEVALVPQIREILSQYHTLVGKLTGKGQRNLTMELKELLKQERDGTDNLKLASEIVDALTEVSIEAEWKFWEALRDSLVPPKEPRELLELAEELSNEKRVSYNVLRTAHSVRTGRYGYGWTFRMVPEMLHAASGAQETRLRLEWESPGRLYLALIGVARADDGWKWLSRSDAKELFDWWSSRLKGSGEEWQTGHWWLGYRYLAREINLHRGIALDAGVIRRFLKGDEVSTLAEELAEEVRATVRGLVGIDAAEQG